MEGRYPPGVLISLTDCSDASKELEFNTWYEKDLIPGLESLGYVQHSRRYQNVLSHSPTFQGRPKYLTISEVYHENLQGILKHIHKREEQLIGGERGFDAFVSKVNTVYRRIGPEFRSTRSGRPANVIYCGLLACADPSREDEFNNWYNERHAPETICNDVFSFDTGYRYKVVDPNDPMPHQSATYLTIYETSASPEETIKGLAAIRKRSVAVSDSVWIELLRVYYAGLFGPIKA